MLSELMDEQHRMTEWEFNFVDDLAEYEDAGRLYSELQKDKIEELHERYC